MSNQLILWDFDGTLANTLGLALEAYNELATEYGFRQVDDPEEVRNQNMRQFLKSHKVPAWRVPSLFARFLKSMKSAIGTVQLFPGITDAVRELKQAGFRHGIVSSNSTSNIQECLKHNCADGLFDDVCGTSQLFGKERRIRTALKQFDVTTEQCLYIGDEVRDIEAAQAGRVAVGCVGWGLNSPEMLSGHSPVFVADEPGHLSQLINQHFLANAG
jgi:phosphoglycolate phosphatase